MESIQDIFLPVMESSVVLASHYAKESGRNTVTATDMMYGLMYAARNVVGKQIGSLFPEIYDESESDEEDLETVDDDEEPFTRYQGNDTESIGYKMNQCADTWDDWVPESPAEQALKSAVENQRHLLG
jgi:hypothetical protein